MKQGNIDLLLARPIGEQSLLQHLRLPTHFEDGDLAELLETSTITLIEDDGFGEAFERVSSLPVTLPIALRDGFRRVAPDERERMRMRIAQQPCSCFLQFQFAALLLGGDEADCECATRLIVRLASDEARADWELFHTLLVWTEACLIADAETPKQTSAQSLAAIWIHAARLHQRIRGEGAPENLVTWLQAQNLAPAVAAFDRDGLSYNDVARPQSFSRTRLLIVGLSHYLSTIARYEQLRRAIAKALTAIAFPDQNFQSPSLELLEQRASAPNRLQSILSNSDILALSGVLGSEAADRFSDAAVEQQVTEYIGNLSDAPSKLEDWICLAAHLQTQPPSDAQRALLLDALTKLSFGSFVAPSLDQLQLVSMFAFGQALHFRATADVNVWEAKLSELADVLSDTTRNFSLEQSATLLGNCAFLAAGVAANETETAKRFSNMAGAISTKWPAAAGWILQPTIRVLLRQPSDRHVVAWRGAAEIRCAAEKLRPLRHLQRPKDAAADQRENPVAGQARDGSV